MRHLRPSEPTGGRGDSFAFDDRQGQWPVPGSKDELLAAFDECTSTGRDFLDGLDDAGAMADWTLVKGGDQLFQMPRIAAIRGFMLNHLYHHRGQLSVCLRMLDQHVASVYGPMADENPFG